MSPIYQSVPPTAEPLNLTAVKNHLRVDSTDDDDLIRALIRAARWQCESFTGRQLVCATWVIQADGLGAMELPHPPLIEIASVTYTDTDAATQTEADTVYEAVQYEFVPYMQLKYGQSWSTVRGHTNDVTVTYRAGYATPFTAVASTGVLTWSGRSPTDTDAVRLSNSGGDLPSPLVVDRTYYVVTTVGATCQLSLTSGGAAITLTDAGTGTHFVGEVPADMLAGMLLYIGHLYENREATIDGKLVAIPYGVEALWYPERVMAV